MLPSKAPEDVDLLYFPFWRFKGMFFSCNPTGVSHKFMDLSYQAIRSNRFPVSVGFRSQALKLRFVTPDMPGRFLRPTLPKADVMAIFGKRYTGSMAKPIVHQSHIGESLSLIYSPFFLTDRLCDGVLNRPIADLPEDPAEVTDMPGGKAESGIGFLPTLCPHCGWDLEGERDSLVLHCKNCNTAWDQVGGKFRNISFGCLPAGDVHSRYMPFWRIRADVEGMALATYADLVRVANLPKAPQPGWEDIGFRFWAPAFKVRPGLFLRLLTNITLSQPREPLESNLPGANVYRVNLPITEAIESMKVNLAAFVKPRQRMIETLPQVHITPRSAVLVYVPFTEKHHDLVQTTYHVAINKNHLKLSTNL